MKDFRELAEHCLTLIGSEPDTVKAYGILKSANVLMGGFGVERVHECGKTLLYVNTGESYGDTLLFADDEFSVGSYAGWLEDVKTEYDDENFTTACGNCGHRTPCAERWNETRCEQCGCNVQDGSPMPKPTDDNESEQLDTADTN